ncbi:alpha-2-macroglobulin family protein [Spirosoma montaniterrae]|uniref:Alpha-2-macroglobulin domain-containing protein n=1 Tax=Spirosoma montaniterrae TaxID=1178516 RepID=A0A1P9X1H5_9BACT|nr:alpha-2-macroglobulin family protein [Spirosoma montaniterrae]AQG81489.1 hypothetical protein AWR27_20530 [Spirosoma montaniterrae]
MSTQATGPPPAMNHLLTILLFLTALATSAQPNKPRNTPPDLTFAREWQRADSLAKKGLPKSALEVVNGIYAKAKATRNHPQTVKAAMHRLVYQPYTTEDTYAEIIDLLRRDIADTPATGVDSPARNILQSILAETYWHYYEQNRWKFGQRNTDDAGSDDPRTWNLRRLVDETVAAYEASLNGAEQLKKTPVEAFDVVVQKGDADARLLRPTLYDFLAHRALGFYKNTEPDITRPANRFELDQSAYLADAETFLTQPLRSTDSLSLKFRALRLYQELTLFHRTNALPMADVDAQRLAFVHQYSTVPNKDDLYQQTLERAIQIHKNQPAEVFYGLALGEFWADRGDRAKTGGWRRKAADLTTDLLRRFPKSGTETTNLRKLLDRLNARSLQLTVEEGNAPDQPIRTSVAYRNVPTLHYRIVSVHVDEWFRNERRLYTTNDAQQQPFHAQLLKRAAVKTGSVRLPNDGDLQEHRTEIALPALPTGHYIVLVSPSARIADTTTLLSYTRLTVTNIGYLIGRKPVSLASEKPAKNGYTDYNEFFHDPKLYVVNRQTGQPMANIRVDLLENNNRTGNHERISTYRTTATGGLEVPNKVVTSNHNYCFRISTKRDTVYTEWVYWPGYQRGSSTNEEQIRGLLFTDRAIYRPGQTIFFKAVLYRGTPDSLQVVPNAQTEATLTDVNGEKVASLKLTSNAFGTIDGQFTAPAGRLLGVMTIRLENNSTSVRVEEYKRPTFEVKIDPVKGSYKLGQVVSVSATAKTFAGAAVDGASVRYRVVRRQRPRWIWWDWYRPGEGRGGRKTEIMNGTLATDVSGAVSLTFTAQPDLTVDRADDPSFMFTVTFDVTDRTGETRSAEQTLTIGYSALTAALDLPADLDNRDRSLTLRVTNAGGERVPVKGQLTISPLQKPSEPLRKRLWEKPDRFALSRSEFKKLFPNDVYADEDQLPEWPKSAAVDTVSISNTDTLKLTASQYPAGIYAADLRVTDAAGERATLTQYFTVTTTNNPIVNARPDDWVKTVTPETKPGEKTVFWVNNGGVGPGGHALVRVVQNGQIREERWVTLAAEPVRVEIPVTKAFVGGFVVAFTRVQDGRVYDLSKTISVPLPDRNLKIETLTFRDHLKPGQPEQWTLRISGPGKDKLIAETVATLYDASLDAFVPLSWPGSPYQKPAQPMPAWSAMGFNTLMGNLFRYDYRDIQPVARRYDALSWGSVGAQRGLFMGFGGGLDEVVRVGYGSPRNRSINMAMAAAPPGSPRVLKGAVAEVSADGDVPQGVEELREAVAAEKTNDQNDTAPDQQPKTDAPPANPRRNFNETAFFFPKLQTDEQGRVLLSFTMPEALTRWRLLAFAHTPDLKTGSLDRTVITQKELMISANVPRFLREGDTLRLTARINNLTNKPLTGTAQLDAFDPATGQNITAKLFKQSVAQSFNTAPAQSTALAWTMVVPQTIENVTFRVSATSGDFSDAEERTVPVLPNRMLVLDSQPFYVNGPGKKEVRLKALVNQNPELPAQPERLTVELTGNPVWTALQSLPYLAEFPYECAEQLFSRFYANALAGHIINARPEIRGLAETWAKQAPANPLETNAELKSVTLDETPWRRDARHQNLQLAQLGRFLQDDALRASQQQALDKLQQLQTTEGGFRWFSGMPIDRTISVHLLTGFGHLAKLGVKLPETQQNMARNLQNRALRYVDAEAKQWVDRQKQEKKTGSNTSDFWPVQYLYARSFYTESPITDKATRDYLQTYVGQNWQTQRIYGQALAALALHRLGDRQTPASILKSLNERAAQSDELGMYWPDNRAGYYWHQAPIETQALLIEAFSEILTDQKAVNAMKQWLLSQKRTTAWPSTKATTEAIYALLLNGDDWLETKSTTALQVGGKPVETAANGPTDYQKITYQPADIKPELGIITVSKSSSGPAWGGIYYQHFEPLDRVIPSSDVKAAMGNLTLTKQLFVERDGPAGPVSTPVTAKTPLKPGDRVRVRVEVRNDRDMQYVHLKDSRASGFEPMSALSGYKYQNGLGYYEAPRDASTDFYLHYLPVGTHVFEYTLRVVHTGDFSSGVATVQCFYAPEFSARSAGGRVRVP